MYFLNPRPTATSLKHCLQKLSPYFLTMGPYWPHRLQGRAPFPYFRCFLGLILAMSGSACYVCAEVVLHERYCFRPRHVVVVPYLGRAYSARSDPVSRASQSDVNGCSEYSQLGDVPGSGDLDMLLDSEGEVAELVEAGLVDFVAGVLAVSWLRTFFAFSKGSPDLPVAMFRVTFSILTTRKGLLTSSSPLGLDTLLFS